MHERAREREGGENERKAPSSAALLVAGYCMSVEEDVPDFHELGTDIERQFHELNALNDAIFIDG